MVIATAHLCVAITLMGANEQLWIFSMETFIKRVGRRIHLTRVGNTARNTPIPTVSENHRSTPRKVGTDYEAIYRWWKANGVNPDTPQSTTPRPPR